MQHLTRLLLLSGIMVLPLNGCMMWMHGMDHEEPSLARHGKSAVKEFSERDITVTLEVTPFVIGEDSAFTLAARQIQQGKPLSGAKVIYRIERTESSGDHTGVSESEEREADEIGQKGLYHLRYRVREPGIYKITALLSMEGMTEAPPLSVSLTRETGPLEDHDRVSRNTWMIIGGVGMAAMMAIMIL